MKVYAKILLWCFGTLLLSLIAFFAVSVYVSMRNVDHGSFVPRLNALLLEESITAYQAHGKPRSPPSLNESTATSPASTT